jgi:hypothetical protein
MKNPSWNWPRILGVALVAQIVCVVVAWWPSTPHAGTAGPLIGDRWDDVDRVEIVGATDASGREASRVVLSRDGSQWVVENRQRYPASTERVDALLSSLGRMSRDATPVATQPESHLALHVADTQFTRRVTLVRGGSSESWLLGRRGGANTHARRLGDDAVYVVRGAGAWDLGATVGGYVDTDWLSFEANALARVTIESGLHRVVLVGQGGAFEVETDDPTAVWDTTRVRRLADAARTVRLVEPADGALDPAQAEVTVTYERTDGETETLWLGAARDGRRLARRSSSEFTVEVSATSVSAIADARLDALRPDPADEGAWVLPDDRVRAAGR